MTAITRRSLLKAVGVLLAPKELLDLFSQNTPKQKVKSKKGDFPLEIRVFYNEKGIVKNVTSSGGWISPEDLPDDENPPSWDIFNGAPKELKFGDDYVKTGEIQEGDLRVTTYRNITRYG